MIGESRRPHVLVVEDERSTRELLIRLLERAEYRVSAVGTTAAARQVLAHSTTVELVLLDLNLPGQDGLALNRELAGKRTFGVIIVTAHADVVDRVVGLELGADDYVTKPFDPAELLTRIKALLRRLGGPASSARAAAADGS